MMNQSRSRIAVRNDARQSLVGEAAFQSIARRSADDSRRIEIEDDHTVEAALR